LTTVVQSPAPLPPGRLLVLPVPDGRRVFAVLAGEADISTAPLLRDRLVDCLAYRPRELVVDAMDLTICDTSGLSALVRAVAVVEGSGVRVTLRPSLQLSWLMATVRYTPRTSGQSGQDPSDCPLPTRSRGTA
jgi:anti-sigma B factor antagonist